MKGRGAVMVAVIGRQGLRAGLLHEEAMDWYQSVNSTLVSCSELSSEIEVNV